MSAGPKNIRNEKSHFQIEVLFQGTVFSNGTCILPAVSGIQDEDGDRKGVILRHSRLWKDRIAVLLCKNGKERAEEGEAEKE